MNKQHRLIPVLFSSRWSPASISGLQLWLDAAQDVYTDAAASTLATADGDVVGCWKDQSGNGYDVSQATAGKKPLLKLGANGINSRPTILFDGTDDLLTRTAADWLGTDSAGSVFVVTRLSSTFNTVSMFLSSADEGSSGQYSMYIYAYINGSSQCVWRINQRNNDLADSLDGNTVLTASSPYLLVYLSSGAAYAGRVNGVAQTLTVAGGANTGDWFADTASRDNLVLGARVILGSEASFLKGAISEILVYGSYLNEADLAEIEAYLNGKYGCY